MASKKLPSTYRQFDSRYAIGYRGEWRTNIQLPMSADRFDTFIDTILERAQLIRGRRRISGRIIKVWHWHVHLVIATVGQLYQTSFEEKDESDKITYTSVSTGVVRHVKMIRPQLELLLKRIQLLIGARQAKIVQYRVTHMELKPGGWRQRG